MTVASLFSDMILIGVFMLVGFFVREIVKPIQKLFLPASLIGGLLALILGQQMLGLVEIPESFSKFSNVLIAPIMAALLFGVTINRKKVVGYLDYICVEQGIYGMQMAVGAALGALLALLLEHCSRCSGRVFRRDGAPWVCSRSREVTETQVQQDRRMRISAFRKICLSEWSLLLLA